MESDETAYKGFVDIEKAVNNVDWKNFEILEK